MALLLSGFLIPSTVGLGYELAVEDTLRRVRIDAPFTGEYTKAGDLTVRPHPGSLPRPPADLERPPTGLRQVAAIRAAQGEAEGFQLVISATDSDLLDVSVSATPLKLLGGNAEIPDTQFTINQVGYVKTAKPAYPVERTGWFADPLLPAARFSIKKGEVQPVWITIRVPVGTPGGTYEGSVAVKPGNVDMKSIPVKLRVWSFTIPEKGSQLKMAFNWDEGGSAAIHGPADWKEKGLKRKYMDCLLEHRMGVDNIYRGTPPQVEDVKYAVERGASNFNVTNVGWPASFTPAQIDTVLKRIEAAYQQYEDAGVAEQAYVFGFDEHYQEMAIPQIYGAIGKKFPKLKRLASTGPRGKPTDEHVDIWAMSLGTYFGTMKAGHIDRLQPKGAQFWLYLSTSAGPPRPNWWIESPLIETRTLFWLAYEVDADGCLYYFINHHEAKPTPIDENAGAYTTWNPRTFPGHNGDGQLIYPGKNGPLASLRMANVRDGVEDYEYMKLLERLLIEKGKVKNKMEARAYIKEKYVRYVGVNFWIHTHEETLLRAIRDRMAEEIEKLSQ
jgi:hypothetical protein